MVGALFLALPKATKPGIQISFLDALFTSTSATCVTGLTVLDTGSMFTLFGQSIILILIQIGGLGLMTYASFFALILGQNISMREKMLMRDVLDTQEMDVIGRLLISTVLFTMIMESVGTLLIFLGLAGSGLSFGERLYSGIFHSIAAFCNAGFSIYPDNLMSLKQNYLVVTTISWLIIFGGLGFPVILNLFSLRLFSQQSPSKMLSVQTRLVLGISVVLILSSMLFILIAENNHTLLGLSISDKILNAFFLSVTPRTAGFNTLDISQLAVPTTFIILFLMFIGASPGSTGGGIKTTTLAVLFAGVWSVMRGRNRMELFKKDIPFMVLNRAIVIFIFSIFFIFLCVLLLTIFEKSPFLDLFFEAVSAFGTVGLSRGVTPLLSVGGKITIILLMFFGRLGALTISLAITRPKETYHYTYPSENVMVG
jgi:trk system potassium uptake protein TrkH